MMASLTPYLYLTLLLVIGAQLVFSGQLLPPIASFRPKFPTETRNPPYERERTVPKVSAQRS